MCLLIHFVLKNVYVPFENFKYHVSIFYKLELLSFEHGIPISHKMWDIICGSFVRVHSSFSSPSTNTLAHW